MVLQRAERDPLPMLAFGIMTLVSGGALIFTLLADLQEEVGFSDTGLGLIAFSFFAAALVVQLGLARLADSGEARKMLLAGVVLSVAALVWFAIGDTLGELIAARALGGVGFGLFDPAAKALVCVGHRDDAGRRLGILAGASTAGLVVAPFAGALVADLTGSVAVPFLVLAALTVVLLPLVAMVPLAESDEPTSEAANPLHLLRRPRVVRSVIVVVALTAPVGMYEVVWSPLMKGLGASTTVVGLTVALYGVPFLLAAPLGGILGDRIGAAKVSLRGGFIMVVVIAVMSGLPTIPMIVGVGVVEAIVNATSLPNAFAAMSRSTSQSEQATGQGLAGAASTLTIALVTLLTGVTWSAGGQRLAFLTAAGISLVLLIVASLIRVDGDESPFEAADDQAVALARQTSG